jgi:hypothetical protein
MTSSHHLKNCLLAISAALAFAGCSSDAQSPAAGADASVESFTGTWRITMGTVTLMCGALKLPLPALSGDQMIETGTDSPLVYVVQSDCRLKLDPDGTTAKVRAGQSCKISAFPQAITVTDGKFKVTGDTAAFEVTGATKSPLDGSDCTATATGTSMRVP